MEKPEDFIRIYLNVLSDELCDDIIKAFEEVTSNANLSKYTQVTDAPEVRIDHALELSEPLFNKKDLCIKIDKELQKYFTIYCDEFELYAPSTKVPDPAFTHLNMFKVQRTPPGGGFTWWHYERMDTQRVMYFTREVTWMIYLNDMPLNDAETEYYYFNKKIKPTKGSLVLWPAGWTHLHRGNTVTTQNTKYIVTGWYSKIFPSMYNNIPKSMHWRLQKLQ